MTARAKSDVHSEMTLPREVYARAEQFLHWNAGRLILRGDVHPNWIDESDRFWYRIATADGHEFILVDAVTGSREPAFDHVRLAGSLSRAAGTQYSADDLPFDEIRFLNDGEAVQTEIGSTRWTCDLMTYECRSVEFDPKSESVELPSPGGGLVALERDHNLHVRVGATGEEIALSHDGVPEYCFATPVLSPLLAAGLAKPDYRQFPISQIFPAAIWSPDDRKILSHRIDERGVGQFTLVQSVPLDGETRPKRHTYSYPLPGDELVPQAELVIFDVQQRRMIPVDMPPLNVLYYGTPLRRDPGQMRSKSVWWSDDGARIYVLRRERGYKSIALYEIDADTGASKVLVEEAADIPVDPHVTHSGEPNVRVIDNGANVVWFSQRDGWGHLYLYDAESGTLEHRITSGEWAVANVLHIDESKRLIYFTAVGREPGRDPYYEFLYRIPVDGGEPELLTPEDAHHSISMSPSGRYFVDSHSTVDRPPVTVLYAADGTRIRTLETTDIELLQAQGWRFPERFRAKARDGVTDVYGVLIRPSNFDSTKTYPVIDSIYAGPQVNQAPVAFADGARGRAAGFWQAQALAELGFVVVMVDGIGMPYRSKGYHDTSYQNLGDGGIADHISALRELKQRYPYLDLDRVGIYGHSAGGYASCHAIFAYPEFYKVCVSSAGNHDHRLDKASWVERYMGLPVENHYSEQANQSLARNLEGKLLLIHGEMDENVHVSSTLVVVDALIEANKDFDLLIMPNRIHACGDDPYFIRRRWDYFVRHLLGAAPPHEYQISKGIYG